MYLSFENELGKINLNGGIWRIKDIEGLGLAEKSVSVITYPDTDGRELLSVVTYGRDITLSGDILRHGEAKNELERAIRILNRNGVLKIHTGSKKRKIACRCSLFSAGTKERNAVYQSFVMQLTCDYPYFEDFEKKCFKVFKREDLICDSFRLPSVFTKRTSRVNVLNSGDEDTYPCFLVICESEQKGDSFGVEIINHTTNQSFKLDYKLSGDEEINIDFSNRTISSNLKTEENNEGNLIGFMSQDSFLSEFYLIPGNNDIEFVNVGGTGSVTSLCEFSNKYVEAVI